MGYVRPVSKGALYLRVKVFKLRRALNLSQFLKSKLRKEKQSPRINHHIKFHTVWCAEPTLKVLL